MLRLGRYKISFGFTCWIQTQVPTRVWHYLFIWIFKEARPNDVDKRKQFPIGTPMEYEGREYRYYKAK